jgi:hypothetical protein
MLKDSASFVLAAFRPSTGDSAASSLGGAHGRGASYSSHCVPQRVCVGPSPAVSLLDECSIPHVRIIKSLAPNIVFL